MNKLGLMLVTLVMLTVPILGQFCSDNSMCAETDYCYMQECDPTTGYCMTRPESCNDIWNPVCGCDGRTYSNACYAAMDGYSFAYLGECETVYCWENSMCDDTEYCYFADCMMETGTCELRPEDCPDVWDPVCGCDEITYTNECFAALEGMSVDYFGECGAAPCIDNSMCAGTEYCYFEECTNDSGFCEPRPEGCDDIWEPVCGCDGQTYSNACYAAMAGMSVDYLGECEPEYCWDNGMCAETDYCFFAECELETGECVPRPIECGDEWEPVCGCNHITYANPCIAAMQGVSIDYPGECEDQFCWENEMCAEDEYCYFEICAMDMGFCQPRPEYCPDVWDPYCGCDGQTYPNDCYAALSGVSVDFQGECGPALCWDNNMCAPEFYCFFEECLAETGECQVVPEICPEVWDPVCGCDGVTYANDCYAAAARISVDYPGECILDCNYIYGDLNQDGTFNVLDVVLLVGLILNGGGDECIWLVADVNQDDEWNVLDVVVLVSLIIGPGN